VGAGGTGGYFGGRLVDAGCDVTFLVREKRAAQLRSDGLVIKSPLGNFSGKVELVTLSELYASFDMIVLSCKAYDLASVVSDLKGRLSQTAYLLPLLNGLAHYEELDLRFGRERVMGGLCHIGVSLSEHGEVLHNNSSQLEILRSRHPARSCMRICSAQLRRQTQHQHYPRRLGEVCDADGICSYYLSDAVIDRYHRCCPGWPFAFA
jgi:2-dehydropantoate 2-reductase